MDLSNTDCHFFYNSTCTKGEDCPYRHCVEALGQKEVCKFWLKRRDCTRKNCPKRHMNSTRDRGSIPCYYETKETGCLKPHCPFIHRKPRTHLQEAIDKKDSSVILPLKFPDCKKSSNDSTEKSTKDSRVGTSRSVSSLASDYNSSSSDSNDEFSNSEAVTSGKTVVKNLVKRVDSLSTQEDNNNNTRGNSADKVDPSEKVHFNSPVPLSVLLNFKTGREEEIVLFSQHARLYRFDNVTKQWKKLGAGEMKILKHNKKCQFRLFLRQEQAPKIACNHLITRSLELNPMQNSNNSLVWSVTDFADSVPVAEMFCIKFKSRDLMQDFKNKVEECKKILEKQATKALLCGKTRYRNHVTSAVNGSRCAPDLPAGSRRKRTDLGASSNGSGIRAPKSDTENGLQLRQEAFGRDLQTTSRKQSSNQRPLQPEAGSRRNIQNGNFENNSGRSNSDVILEFDSSKVPRKPKKKGPNYYEGNPILELGLNARQKVNNFKHGTKN